MKKYPQKGSSSIIIDYIILFVVALCLLSSIHGSFSVSDLVRQNQAQIEQNHRMILKIKSLLKNEVIPLRKENTNP